MLLGFRFSRYQRYPSLYRLGCQVIERSHSSSIEELPPGAKEVKTTVSSLRIDNIASAGLNISRRLLYNNQALMQHSSTYISIYGGLGGFYCAFNRMMWEHFIDGHVLHNGKLAEKKSTIVSVVS